MAGGMRRDFQKGLKVHGSQGRGGHPFSDWISSAGQAATLTLHFWRV